MVKGLFKALSVFVFIVSVVFADDIEVQDDQIVENTYPEDSLETKVAKQNSNGWRRIYTDVAYVPKEAVEATKGIGEGTTKVVKMVSQDTISEASNASKSAVANLEMQEGESLTKSQQKNLRQSAFQKKVNNALNFNAIKTSWFNGFRMNETLSHAMLNIQQDTGDPLFMLEARQQGILDDNYLYFGGKLAALGWDALSPVPNGGTRKYFSYSISAYVASTISEWFTSLLGFSMYSSDNHAFNIDPNTIYLIVGNLSESPYFGYAAISTVMFGNFDIVSNYTPTVTRQYFMQSGGNFNLSYHTDTLHLNAVLLSATPGTTGQNYYSVTNAETRSGVGFSLNSKYVYEMEHVGDYQFFGLAYTDATGFKSRSGGGVGAFDANYGLSYSQVNFELEGVVTDRGVSGLNSSSALSPNNVAGAPYFGSIKPSANLIYDSFLGNGTPVGSWSTNLSYTADIWNRRFIPYADYSQILQNSKNYSYEYGTGFRYFVFDGSWIGMDYSNLTTRSTNLKESMHYLSFNYTLYI